MQLGPWQLLEQLEEDGYTTSWLAVHNNTGDIRSLHLIHTDLADDNLFVQRLLKESRFLLGLQHPNLITFHAVEQLEDRWALVTDDVRGVALADTLRGNSPGWAPQRAASIIYSLSDAIARAIEPRQILHHWLTLHHVVLSPTGHPWLKPPTGLPLYHHPSQSITGSATPILGNPRYFSPEQIMGTLLDQAIHPWQLGCSLYEMITGRSPFEADSSIQFLVQIMRQDPDPASSHVPDLDPELDTIILTALRRERDQRYPSAAAFRDDLSRYLSRIAPPSPLDLNEALARARASLHDKDRLWTLCAMLDAQPDLLEEPTLTDYLWQHLRPPDPTQQPYDSPELTHLHILARLPQLQEHPSLHAHLLNLLGSPYDRSGDEPAPPKPLSIATPRPHDRLVQVGALQINPCAVAWTSMQLVPDQPSEQVRHCGQCDLQVTRVHSPLAAIPLAGSCVFYDPPPQPPLETHTQPTPTPDPESTPEPTPDHKPEPEPLPSRPSLWSRLAFWRKDKERPGEP